MTSFGPHWLSACEPPPADELLIDLAADQGVTLTPDQARGLLALTGGYVREAALLLARMQAAHERAALGALDTEAAPHGTRRDTSGRNSEPAPRGVNEEFRGDGTPDAPPLADVGSSSAATEHDPPLADVEKNTRAAWRKAATS